MKVAISAVLFSDDTLIGAQRPRAFAAALARRGHTVVVFTPEVKKERFSEPPEGVDLVQLPAYASQSGVPGAELPLWQRVLVFASIAPTVIPAFVLARPSLARLFGYPGQRRVAAFDELNERRRMTGARVRALLDAAMWAKAASGVLNRRRGEAEDFDAVFSSYGPFGSLWFGRSLAACSPNAVRITDLRDAMVLPQLIWTVRGILARLEHRVVREASAVTVVSRGIEMGLLSKRANRRFAQKISVLPNGFQRTDAEKPVETNVRRPLRVGYTGQIYRSSQDPKPLFRALAEVRNRNPQAEFEVHYAGNQGHRLREAATAYGLEESVIDYGRLSHEDAIALQRRMDVLLVLSWNRRDSQGIISGKFGEYLAREKPIVAIVSGDLPGSELQSLITSMNIGHVYEEASRARSHEELSDFLTNAVSQANQGDSLNYEPVHVEVNAFDYDTITARLESLFDFTHPDRPRTARNASGSLGA